MTESLCRRWDIFCAVVDNFGDIGVCWRLARQLAAEHGLEVRLWVDDLDTFQRLCPEIDATRAEQVLGGVVVRRWSSPFAEPEPAEVVIEAFACTLPEPYVAAMAARSRKPVWINLEHLSAEDWVRDCHGLASPQPRLPLVKYFYYPGFSARTGGLIREAGLMRRRAAFQADASAVGAFWRSLAVPPVAADELRVSLFCYPNPMVMELFEAWAQGTERIVCLVAQGVALRELAHFSGTSAGLHNVLERGSLEIRILPFLAQGVYDRLLWACDWNFVRGEDSFVRAQWAGRPLVWQAYPQQEGAQFAKLAAFLDLYCAGLPGDCAERLRNFWEAWNRGRGAGEAWAGYRRDRSVLAGHAAAWAEELAQTRDLASGLVEFCGIEL